MTSPSTITRVLFPAFALLGLCADQAHADDAVVGSGSPASCTEAAVDAAIFQLFAGPNFPGGVMTFNCGALPHTITFTSSKGLSVGTLIDGGGRIRLDGQDLTRLFTVSGAQSQVELRGLELLRGRAIAGFGGAVDVAADTSLTISNCLFNLNRADFSGGAVHAAPGASLLIKDSTFSLNRALHGGAIAANGVVTMERAIFSENRAEGDQGGAIQLWFGQLQASDSTFEFNLARNGGALLMRGGNSALGNVRFDANEVTERGGAIALYEGAVVNGDGLTFTSNEAADGGALHLGGVDTGPSPNIPDFGARAFLANSRFENNSAAATGGAISIFAPPAGNGGSFGQMALNRSQLTGNLAPDGGAVWSSGQFFGADLNFENNSAGSGGALSLQNGFDPGAQFSIGFTQLKRTTLQANVASFKGGGMYLLGAPTAFEGVNLVGNAAQYGGGIAVVATGAPISNVSLIDNQATQFGGGLYAENVSQLALDNFSFSGNRALNIDAKGGDLFAGNFGNALTNVQVSHSTLFGGIAASGSAAQAHGTMTSIVFRNSIVLGFGADTCAGSGSFVSANGNFMPGGCNPTGNNDVPISSVGELGLGALSNNGAYALAHVPDASSPLLDHVICPPGRDRDQRQLPAPVDADGNGDALCDTGAIERQMVEGSAAIVLLRDGFETQPD